MAALVPSSPSVGFGATCGRCATRLFLLGFITLFLELALIRFLAGNVWNLSYFPNLVLIGAFLGMGIGFVFAHRLTEAASRRLFEAAALVLLALAAFVHLLRPVVPGFNRWVGRVGGEVYYTAAKSAGDGSSLAFVAWFLAVVTLFALVSQRTARLFCLFSPLRAYTLDIGGSCCGILAFMALSAAEWPASCWFLLVGPVFASLCEGASVGARLLRALPFLAVSLLAWRQDARLLADPAFSGQVEVRWSPYQKVEYIRADSGRQVLFVNGVEHQEMVEPANLPRTFYPIPYLRRASQPALPPYRSVLVIGAGGGNDVAAALASGAAQVDAVEIDPAIARFGREHHPARPYDDPRVTLTITDARAFMTRTRRRYDLIIFALTDSLVKVSPVAQLRLENYVFTVEALTRAWNLRNPDGDLLLYNFYREPWVREKNEELIRRATGKEPELIHRSGDFAMLLAGPRNQAAPPAAAASVDVATDDWPFPYLRQRGMPSFYVRALAALGVLVFLLSLALGRWDAGEAREADARGRWAFFLMGAAFLLLETKSVIQFSLLFGTTWLNNSLVFLAILGLVLLANVTAQAMRDRRVFGVAYALLMVSCLGGLLFPLAGLLAVESPLLRFWLASLLTFSPIFFANLVFSAAFRDRADAERLFGWNLLGATVGGLLEYASMALGYHALALVVAGCYTATFGLLMAERNARPAPGDGDSTAQER